MTDHAKYLHRVGQWSASVFRYYNIIIAGVAISSRASTVALFFAVRLVGRVNYFFLFFYFIFFFTRPQVDDEKNK